MEDRNNDANEAFLASNNSRPTHQEADRGGSSTLSTNELLNLFGAMPSTSSQQADTVETMNHTPSEHGVVAESDHGVGDTKASEKSASSAAAAPAS